MLEFSPNENVLKISELFEELFEHVLYDEEPLFISDEATIWDVSMACPEAILRRCSQYYGVAVSTQDLKLPLWKLLSQLDAIRRRG